MLALAGSVHHTLDVLVPLLCVHTRVGVTVAGARTTDYHAADGEIVFLHHLLLVIKEVVVSEGVQSREGQPQVCGLEQVLHLLAVRVKPSSIDVDVRWKHSVDDLMENLRMT